MENKDISVKELRVDGGVTRNEFLMQFQADILGKKIVKPSSTECTALGAIYMAGLSLGHFKSLKEIQSKIQVLKEYKNTMNTKTRLDLLDGWHKAVKRTIGDN